MPVKKLKEFLDGNGVKYVSINHSAAYTAQEIAASAHVRGKELAKTVMVTLVGRMAMAVLPAARKISFDLLRAASGADEEIAFNAGSHTELIRLAFRDFERLVGPKAAKIAYGE